MTVPSAALSADRSARYNTVSGRLSALDDSSLLAALEGAAGGGAGIGGRTAELTIDGISVFVKRVPLTDLERRPEHHGSTANLFRLPMFYQYGVGSTGFGAWRELAVQQMATRWVLDNRFDGFPLLYHWRVLPQVPGPPARGELDRWVTHWARSGEVRSRLEAISGASANLVLFMEYIPHTVDSWLTAQTAVGGRTADAAYAAVEHALLAGVGFLRAQGLLHFDAHFRNLLTDGRRVYFADFGLALHSGFRLSTPERAFFDRHANYDRCYTVTHLSQWLVSKLLDLPWAGFPTFIREYRRVRGDTGLPPAAAGIVARHAPVAAVMADFYSTLENESRRARYPAVELGRALDR